ncbi:Phosphoribosylformylglycinamidine synthase subunit PurL [Planctomycetales bacterium 10988]|nr:Phosphoribosylformylglycinamidine synthase subunit PurL [Planctomycetales bacterium 10988]
MLWEIDIQPRESEPNLLAQRVITEATELGIQENLTVDATRGYLIQGELTPEEIQLITETLLYDSVVETVQVGKPNEDHLLKSPSGNESQLVYVLAKPGVMDPVAQSTHEAIARHSISVDEVRTLRKYWFEGIDQATIEKIAQKILANDAIEQVYYGSLPFQQLDLGKDYQFEKLTVSLSGLSDEALMEMSLKQQLYLQLAEMQTIQKKFDELGRDPTDIELETIAQTWSEHCSHKTLAGRIHYQDEKGERQFENMLKETIFAATQQIRKAKGEKDWCVSVFEDNAGIVRFDEENDVVFKVETHNHPSAIEPYGGANTGLGGVIRDPLGTGLGAKPVCNTDVFCFADPSTAADSLPTGVLHPKRVLQGVVAGVRDYGNRMGIPTVNGAVYFDKRFLGNPLVYCGNVGIIPRDKTKKKVHPGDLIVAIGGKTGRDGIHGATFSSAELTEESETISGGAVQIGNAITEKMVLDVLLQARDQNLYNAVTDCGAGGFSSAVGEMGEKLGAEVWLDKVPLKYEGLNYTEIWISEAQERMVLSVSEEQWSKLKDLCSSENVDATVIGKFVDTGKLTLNYEDKLVGELEMSFLHDGRPPVIRDAVYQPAEIKPWSLPQTSHVEYSTILKALLSSLNIASKEWIIRQYDHEVQGGSVIKPLVGVVDDGPSDAAVVRPRLDSRKGLVISCGMNPNYGDYDPFDMAASAIDEAIRNNVAVGGDPEKIAILDNFCWGNTEKPETLGTLVRAALACQQMAIAFQTPFISGKDSLNNEFRYKKEDGTDETIAIPSTLLISAMGQVEDVADCVTMDLKAPGNFIYQVGLTKEEMGGSHFNQLFNLDAGQVPQVDPSLAKRTFMMLHRAIKAGSVASCHDLSEGGLAVALAEMAFAGGLGVRAFLAQCPHAISTPEEETQLSGENDKYNDQGYDGEGLPAIANREDAACLLMFSESNSRFLCEVPPDQTEAFEKQMEEVPHALIGEVVDHGMLEIVGLPHLYSALPEDHWEEPMSPVLIRTPLEELKAAWQKPLKFN